MAENELIDALQKAFGNCINIGALSERANEHQSRLNDHALAIKTLEIGNARREENEKNIISKLDAIASAVEELKCKPNKRYDLIWGIVVTTIITAIISIYISNIVK